MVHPTRRLTALLVLCCCYGCASTPATIPDVRAKDVGKPTLPGVEPRTVRLEIVDERNPAPAESEESVNRVRLAVVEALGGALVTESSDSPNQLTVVFEYPAELPDTFTNPFQCVLIRARLKLKDGRAESWSTSCHHADDAVGFSMGTDITDSFRSALRGAFGGLDRKLMELQKGRAKRSSVSNPHSRARASTR